MTEEDLDGPDLDTGLHQMSGEAVSQRVSGYFLGESARLACLDSDPGDRAGGERPIEVFLIWKQPGSWSFQSPVFAKQ